MTNSSLDAEVSVTVADDTVDFEFAVSNDGEESVTMQFRTGQSVDFVVLHDGEEVWRWSAGRMFTQALRYESLEPGESAVYEATWPDPRPGESEALATLEADNLDLEARTPFVV